MRPTSQCDWDNLVRSRAERHPSRPGNARFREPGRSVTRNRRPSDQIGGRLRRNCSAPSANGNHENTNKCQRPEPMSGPLANPMAGKLTLGRNADDLLLVLFGLLFRGRQAFETFQELFLGHALDGHFGIVGIDAGTRRADQGNRIGFRLVDLDELLQ